MVKPFKKGKAMMTLPLLGENEMEKHLARLSSPGASTTFFLFSSHFFL